jgi:hypothetical protein
VPGGVRFAGSASAASTPLVTGRTPLVNGADYNSHYSGEMSRAVYCVGSLTTVRRCLAANLGS